MKLGWPQHIFIKGRENMGYAVFALAILLFVLLYRLQKQKTEAEKLVSKLKVQEKRLNAAAQEIEKAQVQAGVYVHEIERLKREIERLTGNNASLDSEQAFALKKMENSSENYFITGKAGTGKSFLLDAFKKSTRKKNLVLAPTGIAALHVDGATLHRTFGYRNLVHLSLSSISQETIQLSSEKRQLLKEARTIIIDEISMVRADTFDKIDRILKVINRNNQPFGGKQMLLFGDLFQLPPVAKKRKSHFYTTGTVESTSFVPTHIKKVIFNSWSLL